MYNAKRDPFRGEMKKSTAASAVVLEVGDLIQAALVPTAFVFGAQPHINHTPEKFFTNQVGRQAEDVGIVVPAG